MTAKKKSAADRKAEMEALHAQLAEQVEQLRTSEQWARYLEFCRSFHRYSIGNLLLIFAQAPEATQVAGYRTWQKLGRQVRKGEHGIRIIGTGTKKVESEDDETGEVVEGKRRVFFPVSVFDQAQTDLMEGREDVSEVARKLEGEDAAGICTAVAAYLVSSGVIVKRENITNGANGYTRKQDDGSTLVVVDDRHSPAQAAKTMLHEAAHITLGHVDDDYSEYVAHRGRYEVEAESVAYVVAGLLGLDTSEYSTGYVAGWATKAEADVLKETAARVLAASHTLAEALQPDSAEIDAA